MGGVAPSLHAPWQVLIAFCCLKLRPMCLSCLVCARVDRCWVNPWCWAPETALREMVFNCGSEFAAAYAGATALVRAKPQGPSGHCREHLAESSG